MCCYKVVSAYMMMDSLNKEGYNAYSFAVPTPQELWKISALAAPVFISIFSKIAFYSFIIYCATSMGTHVLAAHQVYYSTYTYVPLNDVNVVYLFYFFLVFV